MRFFVFSIVFCFLTSSAFAQKILGNTCVKVTGESFFAPPSMACPKPGGTIAVDVLQTPVCGLGQCTRDFMSRIICAKSPGGAIGKDIIGNIQCVGGCEEARSEYCEKSSQ